MTQIAINRVTNLLIIHASQQTFKMGPSYALMSSRLTHTASVITDQQALDFMSVIRGITIGGIINALQTIGLLTGTI